MPVVLDYLDASDRHKLEHSYLLRFMEEEVDRVLGDEAKKGYLCLHRLEDPDYGTLSFRNGKGEIVVGTPEFSSKLKWDWERLLNWKPNDYSEQYNSYALKPFHVYLEKVKQCLSG